MTRFDQPSEGGYEPSASGVSHRVQSILEAAEQAARDIRYEAEMEKRRMTRESDRRVTEVDDGLRRMAAVADALVERADELRRQVDEMIGALRRPEPEAGEWREPLPRHAERPARPRFTGAGPRPRVERRAPEPPPAPEPEPAAVEPEPLAVEPEPEPVYAAAPEPAYEAPVEPPPAPGEMGPERLVAIQMAMAGRSREEAADRLVRGFGLQDPKAILDEVFG